MFAFSYDNEMVQYCVLRNERMIEMDRDNQETMKNPILTPMLMKDPGIRQISDTTRG